jgi:hypothetical protein
VQPDQTDAQANQTGAAQDLTLYQEESAAQQIEGKPRCITFMLKSTRTYVNVPVH